MTQISLVFGKLITIFLMFFAKLAFSTIYAVNNANIALRISELARVAQSKQRIKLDDPNFLISCSSPFATKASSNLHRSNANAAARLEAKGSSE